MNIIETTAPETAETTRKPATPVCELFERQPNRPPVWCNHCGRHKELHSAVEPEEEAEPAVNPFDPLGCRDMDTFNAIYKGGNSSPFPYDSNF